MEYRLRPRNVNACRWMVDTNPGWLDDLLADQLVFVNNNRLTYFTLKKTYTAEPGDYIIKDGNNIATLSSKEFDKYYEMV